MLKRILPFLCVLFMIVSCEKENVQNVLDTDAIETTDTNIEFSIGDGGPPEPPPCLDKGDKPYYVIAEFAIDGTLSLYVRGNPDYEGTCTISSYVWQADIDLSSGQRVGNTPIGHVGVINTPNITLPTGNIGDSNNLDYVYSTDSEIILSYTETLWSCEVDVAVHFDNCNPISTKFCFDVNVSLFESILTCGNGINYDYCDTDSPSIPGGGSTLMLIIP